MVMFFWHYRHMYKTDTCIKRQKARVLIPIYIIPCPRLPMLLLNTIVITVPIFIAITISSSLPIPSLAVTIVIFVVIIKPSTFSLQSL